MTDIDVPDDLQHLFTYHEPQEGQVLLYERLRSAALAFAREIDTPLAAGPFCLTGAHPRAITNATLHRRRH